MRFFVVTMIVAIVSAVGAVPVDIQQLSDSSSTQETGGTIKNQPAMDAYNQQNYQ
ncbi:hypothetical protein WALSEDRAFT_64790 [Wallemia mellicola CBS 633.66]|uniref:Uncharacterized protein n=1 Tax=Wallemia mellicola (strain ATCC MYA-4683 / CBS 633.66) TaxID=671144 RepID=I4YB62_WALMC|nr:hypothetical protein WALSEDRAFT_64790 [Wallemia mellicola CBS 633.66]EIM21204.1 hypothetical protein WALSEDRAFT_64790 [Wallemia mellicola CBS 633.66]|eukprot:XP_006958876.1 hypothetical protein WALSEDRAFT_64790 [Wallemia mellicola CBS 633.66]